jgi:hypothetical protein
VLGTPRARANGPAFTLGWIVGLVAVSVIILVVAGGADDPDSATSTGVNWVQVGVGLLFFSLAHRQWRSRPARGEEVELPKWMASVDHFGPVKTLGLGLALSAANPKNLVLTAAGAAAIAQAGLSTGDEAVALVVFVGIASITVAGSVALYLVAGERAAAPLASIKDFMGQHSAVIMMVLFLVLGAKILGDGLGGFAR